VRVCKELNCGARSVLAVVPISNHVDWSEAQRAVFLNLKLSRTNISFSSAALMRIKPEANKGNVPYQSLIKAVVLTKNSRLAALSQRKNLKKNNEDNEMASAHRKLDTLGAVSPYWNAKLEMDPLQRATNEKQLWWLSSTRLT
jgi:CopG antitoxin of type II toxin-antitoxin system